MTEDARFEDAPLAERPLRLRAMDADDLAVLSSLVQDAVGRVGEIHWLARHRRLVVVFNRFRWEDAPEAESERRPFERVRALLSVDGVMSVRARGLDPGVQEQVYVLLALAFEPGEDGAGTLRLSYAGGGELLAEVEMLDATLADLTRPWQAQAQAAPRHED